MKKLFNSIDTIIRWLENIVCGATLTAIVCIATATVIARYIFQTGFLWADEVNQALLVAMGMFGSARAVRTNGHTEFTMLVNKPKSKAVRIALRRGDMLFMASDGVMDACPAPELSALLRAHARESARSACAAVLRAPKHPKDDMTAILVKLT